MKVYFLIVALIISIVVATLGEQHSTEAFTNQVLRRGATGEDVIELQSRLEYIGYYKGSIDGVFGWETHWAVRSYQEAFGMKVDGIVGEKTKQKLLKSTKYTAKDTDTSTNVPSGYSQNDINLMANAVYGESRGEPYEGQVAVAAVILNRVEHSSFPNSVSSVIYQPGAFTAVADGQINLTPNDVAKKAVMDALSGWDPTGNCIYYFNPKTATSEWIWGRPQVITIGQHIFCK